MQTFSASVLGNVELTTERKAHVLKAHPELKPHLKKLSKVLSDPDEIRISRLDKNVLLFYKFFAKVKSGKYINVTVKTGDRNYILTAYITDRIRAGEKYDSSINSGS